MERARGGKVGKEKKNREKGERDGRVGGRGAEIEEERAESEIRK